MSACIFVMFYHSALDDAYTEAWFYCIIHEMFANLQALTDEIHVVNLRSLLRNH